MENDTNQKLGNLLIGRIKELIEEPVNYDALLNLKLSFGGPKPDLRDVEARIKVELPVADGWKIRRCHETTGASMALIVASTKHIGTPLSVVVTVMPESVGGEWRVLVTYNKFV